MALEDVPVLFTSQAEMESLFGSIGIQLRIDDDDDELVSETETGYLEDIMLEGTDICNKSLGWIYDVVDLEESLWVRRRCTWIACYLLAKRRGNPSQFLEQYERCLSDFKDVEEHRRWIPRKNPKYNFAPAMSNLRVDYRYNGYHYGGSPLRVDPISSTNNGGSSIFKDWAYWGWV